MTKAEVAMTEEVGDVGGIGQADKQAHCMRVKRDTKGEIAERRYEQDRQQGWNESQRSTGVEAGQGEVAVKHPLLEQERGDEKAAEDEEEVNAEPTRARRDLGFPPRGKRRTLHVGADDE